MQSLEPEDGTDVLSEVTGRLTWPELEAVMPVSPTATVRPNFEAA
jgi:hypothetical protein